MFDKKTLRLSVLCLPILGVAGCLLAQSAVQQELTPQERSAFEAREATRLERLANRIDVTFRPVLSTHSQCGNGDLEGGLDGNEWTGGHGSIGMHGAADAGDPDFDNFTAGLFPGPISSSNSHQTAVGAAPDATGVPIAQVAPRGLTGSPSGSTGAVRIGNSSAGYGSELLSKTFVVSPSQPIIRFWYAVVLENPRGHAFHEQPSFWVRVLDANGDEIAGAVDLGNGSAKAVADQTNPFYDTLFPNTARTIVYRDWSCAEIDLSGHVGETVTVQFVTEDCARGAHYGYAYVDNLCGICTGDPGGSLSHNAAASADCGTGQVCFDYKLPVAADATGSATIKLTVEQNGSPLATLVSPTLTTGTSYCFDLEPAADPALASASGTVDLVATAQFEIDGVALAPKSASIDDYALTCDGCSGKSATRCCKFGACCVGSACVQVAPEACEDLGGIYFGDLSTCQVGACCVHGSCVRIPKSECRKLGGNYLGDQTSCAATTCGLTDPGSGANWTQ